MFINLLANYIEFSFLWKQSLYINNGYSTNKLLILFLRNNVNQKEKLIIQPAFIRILHWLKVHPLYHDWILELREGLII